MLYTDALSQASPEICQNLPESVWIVSDHSCVRACVLCVGVVMVLGGGGVVITRSHVCVGAVPMVSFC